MCFFNYLLVNVLAYLLIPKLGGSIIDIFRSYSLHLDVRVNHCTYAGCATAVVAFTFYHHDPTMYAVKLCYCKENFKKLFTPICSKYFLIYDSHML